MNLVKIGLYPIIVVISYWLVKRDWRRYSPLISEKKRIRTGSIILISLLIGLYSMSFNHTFWWMDVAYYNEFFSNGLSFPDSVGLNIIYLILHIFTRNIDILLFTVAFLSTFTMLIAYREYEEAFPISILFLFFTPFFIETCQVNLKQGIACGLAGLCINEILKKRYLRVLLLFILASLFHVTAAIILLLTFIAIKAVSIKHKGVKLAAFAFVLLCFVFYDKMFSLLSVFASFIPKIGNKLAEYASNSGSLEADSTGNIIFKGIPYYIITIAGFAARKQGCKTIRDYDGFLVVSVLASLSYILSFQSYWMSRIIDYYWITDFVFLGLLLSRMKSRTNILCTKYSVGLFLIFLTIRQLIQMY